MSQSRSAFIPGQYIATPPMATAKVPVLSHPTSNVKIIAQLPAGCAIDVLGRESIWLRIRLPEGQVGYIAAANASPKGLTPTLPGTTIASPATRQPLVSSGETPRVEAASAPKRTGAKVGVMLLGMLSGIGLGFGILLSSIEQVSCPIYVTSAYSDQCTPIGRPYADTGHLLLVLGGIGVVLAIILAVRLRSKRK